MLGKLSEAMSKLIQKQSDTNSKLNESKKNKFLNIIFLSTCNN